MKNNDKAFVWQCHDFSDDEPRTETLAIRLQTLEAAKQFKDAFEAGKLFNKLVKEGGKDEELVYAEVIEDHEEKVDPEDDPEHNKTADAEGDKDEWGIYLFFMLIIKISFLRNYY